MKTSNKKFLIIMAIIILAPSVISALFAAKTNHLAKWYLIGLFLAIFIIIFSISTVRSFSKGFFTFTGFFSSNKKQDDNKK
ncbi:hypothetical protein [uncultured Clostridium sp.]|uniref:hypothetical protein n=1 Tax=uncultured Clostridium sp. TaxID=59620 RepID=UPI0026375597|nr:hypothetical protein [uncultured Clostridium sp.]